jgi:hypothetical protein
LVVGLLLSGVAEAQTNVAEFDSVAVSQWKTTIYRTDEASSFRACGTIKGGDTCYFAWGEASGLGDPDDGTTGMLSVAAAGGAEFCVEPNIEDGNATNSGTTFTVYVERGGRSGRDSGSQSDDFTSVLYAGSAITGPVCFVAPYMSKVWGLYALTSTTHRPHVVVTGLGGEQR